MENGYHSMKVKYKTVSRSGNPRLPSIDANYRYQVQIHGVKMYTGNNPIDFHCWRFLGWLIGEYSYVWLKK
jgi:hypothetical protein